MKAISRLLTIVCLVGFAASARAQAPTITDFSPPSGPVGTQVTINGTGFTAPFAVTFTGNVDAAGNFTSTQIKAIVPSGAQTGPITVTTASGSVATATSFTVGALTTPVATLTATVPTASVSTGQDGEYTVSLSSAPASDVVVSYTLQGTATNGTDYSLLKGSITVKAGKTSKVIKVVPLGNLGGASKKTVKLTLEPGTGYTVGTTTFEKVKIVQ